MSKRRRLPLLTVAAVVLVATGFVTSLRHATNPSQLPSGLKVSLNAESTALYCTGISSAHGAPGRVSFYNTASASRSLSVSVVSDKGNTWQGSIELAAHLNYTHTGLTRVQISGGGVVGEEIAGTDRSEVPCSASGVTRWYATGFDTSTGSSAYLSVYNPTATSAVFNASIYATTGYSAPQAFQGIAVPAHAQTEVDLGKEVVNTSNVGVGVTVLRGSLEIVGVENSAGTVSYDQGLTDASKHSWLPNVTTVEAATAQIRVANPNDSPAQVTVDVALSNFKVPPQRVTIAPLSTGVVVVTPNPAIPAAGYANLTVHSNVPVVSALATGTGKWFALSSPATPSNAFLVGDFSGIGFAAATVTNTSSRATTVDVSTFNAPTSRVVTSGINLSAGQTTSLFATIPSFSRSPSATYLLTSTKPSMVVSLTLPSRPVGLYVVTPLDGR